MSLVPLHPSVNTFQGYFTRHGLAVMSELDSWNYTSPVEDENLKTAFFT